MIADDMTNLDKHVIFHTGYEHAWQAKEPAPVALDCPSRVALDCPSRVGEYVPEFLLRLRAGDLRRQGEKL